MNFREELLKSMKSSDSNVLDDETLLKFSKKVIDYMRNSEEPFKLYRYMPFNYNNLRSVETGRIYLSELGKMNDVFEGLMLLNTEVEINMNDLYDLVYLKAFSERKHNLLMWSHYGENHKGICVEYDLKQLREKIDGKIPDEWMALYHIFPVIYSEFRRENSIKLSNITYAAKSIRDYKYDIEKNYYHPESEWHHDTKSLFLTKSIDWEYEKEWRIILTFHQLKGQSDESIDSKKVLYELNEQNLNFDCISAIYCGINLRKDRIDHIHEIVSRVNRKRESEDRCKIKLYKCSIDSSSDSYKINEKEV